MKDLKNLLEVNESFDLSFKTHEQANNAIEKWYAKYKKYMSDDEIIELLQSFINDIKSM